jgi:hypothetical protein
LKKLHYGRLCHDDSRSINELEHFMARELAYGGAGVVRFEPEVSEQGFAVFSAVATNSSRFLHFRSSSDIQC